MAPLRHTALTPMTATPLGPIRTIPMQTQPSAVPSPPRRSLPLPTMIRSSLRLSTSRSSSFARRLPRGQAARRTRRDLTQRRRWWTLGFKTRPPSRIAIAISFVPSTDAPVSVAHSFAHIRRDDTSLISTFFADGPLLHPSMPPSCPPSSRWRRVLVTRPRRPACTGSLFRQRIGVPTANSSRILPTNCSHDATELEHFCPPLQRLAVATAG